MKSQIKLSRLNRFTAIQSSPCNPRRALPPQAPGKEKPPKKPENEIKRSSGLEVM